MSSVKFAIPDFCSLTSAQEREPAGLMRRHQGPEESGLLLERALDASSASRQDRVRASFRETNWTKKPTARRGK